MNEQGEDRIKEIKQRNIILKQKSEDLSCSLKIQREHGAHMDQIAAFWRDNKVSVVATKKSFRKEERESEPREEEIVKPVVGTSLLRCGGTTTKLTETSPALMRGVSHSTKCSDSSDSDCGS